jgi:ABC-2 type transport system permease protein
VNGAFFICVLRDKWRAGVVFAVATLALLEMYVALFPSIAAQADQLDALMQSLPEQLYAALNVSASALSFSNLSSYLATEYMSLIWPILTIAFALSLANQFIVTEIDKGTVDLIATLPVGRVQMFIERYLAGFLMLMVFTLITILSIVPLASIQDIDVSADPYLTTCWGALFFTWAVYALALLVSAICSEKSRATMVTCGILLLMYVLSVIAGLNTDFENLQYLSFFHYFSGATVLAENSLSSDSLVVLTLCALCCSFVAGWWFSRRDLSA